MGVKTSAGVKILVGLLIVWGIVMTALAIYEHSWAKQMLAIAEQEYDRRLVEEQFFSEFVNIQHVIVDPHTNPFEGEPVDEAPKTHGH